MKSEECKMQSGSEAQAVNPDSSLFTLHSALNWGRGRQVMHLPCKQADAGALPADSTNFNCGENEIQASLISSASVGATPTPATNFGEVFRLPVCKTGVANNCRK